MAFLQIGLRAAVLVMLASGCAEAQAGEEVAADFQGVWALVETIPGGGRWQEGTLRIEPDLLRWHWRDGALEIPRASIKNILSYPTWTNEGGHKPPIPRRFLGRTPLKMSRFVVQYDDGEGPRGEQFVLLAGAGDLLAALTAGTPLIVERREEPFDVAALVDPGEELRSYLGRWESAETKLGLDCQLLPPAVVCLARLGSEPPGLLLLAEDSARHIAVWTRRDGLFRGTGTDARRWTSGAATLQMSVSGSALRIALPDSEGATLEASLRKAGKVDEAVTGDVVAKGPPPLDALRGRWVVEGRAAEALGTVRRTHDVEVCGWFRGQALGCRSHSRILVAGSTVPLRSWVVGTGFYEGEAEFIDEGRIRWILTSPFASGGAGKLRILRAASGLDGWLCELSSWDEALGQWVFVEKSTHGRAP